MEWLRWLVVAVLACTAAAPWPARAADALRVRDVELGAETEHFELRTWRGRPAVSAFTRKVLPDAATELSVQTVLLDDYGWRVVGRWALPGKTRYIEALVLPGPVDGWLLLVGEQWQIAIPEGDALVLRPLCPCDTIYSHGGAPDPRALQFAYDLDGDGIDEVVLPYSQYLEAYRITPLVLAPEPLWRVEWHEDGTPLQRSAEAEKGFLLPTFSFPDVDGDRLPELLIAGRAKVQVAALPGSAETESFALDASRRNLLKRRSVTSNLPGTLLESMRRMGDRRFTSADAILNALLQPATREQQAEWAPFLLQVLTITRSRLLTHKPYDVPLDGLGAFGEKDRAVLLAAQDMDGDGVLDVLHAKLIEAGSVFNQENELRWYRGSYKDDRLALTGAGITIRTDAGSFAELVRPRRNNEPPHALLVALAEVSLSSVMQALASQSVTLQASLRPWQGDVLPQLASTAHNFTYSGLRTPGRRPMILFADLNGDGWRDALLNLGPDELSVFLTDGGGVSLARPSFVQGKAPLPSRPERVLIADLDGDGREELVLRFRADYHGALGTKLRLLQLDERLVKSAR